MKNSFIQEVQTNIAPHPQQFILPTDPGEVFGYEAACRDENENKGEEEQAESQRDLLDESNVTHLLGCLL